MKVLMLKIPFLLLCLAMILIWNCGCPKDDSPAPEVVSGNNQTTDPPVPLPQVKIETTMGDIVVELYPEAAPITVKNFLQYVNDKQYDGSIFHRVISDFMIQGGGVTVELTLRPPRDPIVNESDNGLKNVRGALTMSRNTDLPDSATSMFFINRVDNSPLDHGDPLSPDGFGYTVFGRVVQGIEVVDKIAEVPVTNRGTLMEHLPVVPVVMIKVSVIN